MGTLQNWAAVEILRQRTGNKEAQITMLSVPMIVDVWELDGFAVIYMNWFPFCLLMGFAPLMYRSTY